MNSVPTESLFFGKKLQTTVLPLWKSLCPAALLPSLCICLGCTQRDADPASNSHSAPAGEQQTSNRPRTSLQVTVNKKDGFLSVHVDVPPWQAVAVQTENGSRQYIKLNDAQMRYDENTPPCPVVVKTMPIGKGFVAGKPASLQITDEERVPGIVPPLVRNVPFSSSQSPFIGAPFGRSGLFPAELAEVELVNEVGAENTLVIRLFPVRYDYRNKVALIPRRISFQVPITKK